MRRAHRADKDDLLRWRNDPVTRKASLTTGAVDVEQHEAWFRAALQNPSRTIWIAERDEAKVGMVRLDVSEEGRELSWAVAPEARGQGVGAEIVRLGLDLAGGAVFARIRADNEASLRIACRCGFAQVAQVGGVTRWESPQAATSA